MLLPNAGQAVVEKAKITEYLLSPDHPDGRSKAEFFGRFGFRRQEWEVLADALRVHCGCTGQLPLSQERQLPFGEPVTALMASWIARMDAAHASAQFGLWRLRARTRMERRRGSLQPTRFSKRLKRRMEYRMIAEHERIVLTAPLPEEGLEAGDVGTVVFVHAQGEAYEVEFVTLGGATAAVATVPAQLVRPVNKMDLVHTRQFAASA